MMTAFFEVQTNPATDIPHDRIWAEVAERVPGKSAFECDQLASFIYFNRQPSEDIFPNLGWWDALDLEDANRSSCPTFSHVPEEHASEIARLRIDLMRALEAAGIGSAKAASGRS